MDIVLSLSTWDLLEVVAYPILRQFEYVISSESYARDLQKEFGKLKYQVDWVDFAVDKAKMKSQDFYCRLPKWKVDATSSLVEVRVLLGDFEKASKTCCCGTLPNPMCRYQFSKMAMREIRNIQRLVRECNGFKVADISFSGAPAIVNTTSIKLREDDVFESRASITQEIMDTLANNRINVVGVYGMGGIGKSTLLADVERRIREEKSFDWVAEADVSKYPDIKRIQGEIADALDLSNIKNRETVRGRAELLHRRLEDEEKNKRKVLIILDNLWEGLDLKSVGIPCGHDNYVRGCKLLLTSRDRSVLRREMGCDRDFRLDGLKEEEAKRLFERLVGDKVHNDEFKPWVEVALNKCAGVPFLIVAMAKRLRCADFSEWKETLEKIEKPKHRGFSEVMNNILRLSYDPLDEEMKSFLQLCVVYVGSEPSLENLVKYGFDLGLFQEASNIEEARESLRSGIRNLNASSLLLEDGEADGFKIHPLVREFVISTTTRDPRLLLLNDKGKKEMEYLKTQGTY